MRACGLLTLCSEMSEIDNMELKETDACDGFDGSHPMVQQTNYTKSLRHYITREALPSENNYRHLDSIVQNNGPPRATLAEMLQNTYVGQVSYHYLRKNV